MSEPIKGIQPIRLPAKRKNKYDGCTATVAGWGIGSTGLEAVDVEVHPEDFCKQNWWQWNSDVEICAGQGGKKDACRGDSGGPLYLKENGKFTQIGVVSGGDLCFKENSSRPGNIFFRTFIVYVDMDYSKLLNSGIYANVAHFKKWIRQNAQGALGSRAP